MNTHYQTFRLPPDIITVLLCVVISGISMLKTSGRSVHSGSFLFADATQVQGQSFIISRWDYCTSRLESLPLRAIKCPGNDQNAAARPVLGSPKSSHITPLTVLLMLVYKAKENQPVSIFLKAVIKPHSVAHSVKPVALLDQPSHKTFVTTFL